MRKSNHTGTGDTPANQNNAMSDDPRDGSRNSFTAEERTGEAPPAPDEQGKHRLRELGQKGSKQP
jgi:hypothetical protein